ncbi:MAG: hypothetical protein QNJ85_13040 [Gammaproteobacteria bacterium]|nr:hypothetical protein [Gammaproteobacteria bacterium]
MIVPSRVDLRASFSAPRRRDFTHLSDAGRCRLCYHVYLIFGAERLTTRCDALAAIQSRPAELNSSTTSGEKDANPRSRPAAARFRTCASGVVRLARPRKNLRYGTDRGVEQSDTR